MSKEIYNNCNHHLVQIGNKNDRCIPRRIDFGQVEQFDFVHPRYLLSNGDPMFGNIWSEYKTAFVYFVVHKN
jgi:hypothetical protein